MIRRSSSRREHLDHAFLAETLRLGSRHIVIMVRVSVQRSQKENQ